MQTPNYVALYPGNDPHVLGTRLWTVEAMTCELLHLQDHPKAKKRKNKYWCHFKFIFNIYSWVSRLCCHAYKKAEMRMRCVVCPHGRSGYTSAVLSYYALLPSSKKGGKEKTRIMERVDTSGCYVRDEDCPDTISECFARVDAGCGVSIKPYNLQLTNLPASDRTYLAVLPACW